MAWNGSQRAGYSATNKASSTPQKKSLFHSSTSTSNFDSHSPHHSSTSTSNFNYKLAALVAVALVALAAALFYILSPAPAPAPSVGPDRRSGRTIKEAPPAPRVADLLADVKSGKPSKEMPPRRNEKVSAKTLQELRPDIDWKALTDRTFSTGTEQLLSWVCHAVPGEMMLPLPPLTEEDKANMAGILISKNEIRDTDSEDVAQAKQDVDFAKRELAEFIRDGGSPEEFFDHYNDVIQDAFQKRNEIIDELRYIQSDEGEDVDPKMMGELVKRASKILEDDGIKGIAYDEKTNSIY